MVLLIHAAQIFCAAYGEVTRTKEKDEQALAKCLEDLISSRSGSHSPACAKIIVRTASAQITGPTVDATSPPYNPPFHANPKLFRSFTPPPPTCNIRDLSHKLSFGCAARQKNSLRSPWEAGLGAVAFAVQLVVKPAIDFRAYLLSLLSRPLWQIAFSKAVWVGGLVWLYASSLVGHNAALALISKTMTRLTQTLAWAFSALRVRVEK